METRGCEYKCTYLGPGTGSASEHLSPMLTSWANHVGEIVSPGTLNLRADRPVIVPLQFITLMPFAAAAPAWRQCQPGFSPRLYPAQIAEGERVWLFRWSSPEYIHEFVGSVQECPADCRCEIVASRKLADAYSLQPGAGLTMRLSDQ